MNNIGKYLFASIIGLGLFVGIANAATLQGFQGGTGFATTTAGNVGKAIIVASTSPFLTYDFGTAGSAATTTYLSPLVDTTNQIHVVTATIFTDGIITASDFTNFNNAASTVNASSSNWDTGYNFTKIMTTLGDTIYGGASGVGTRLPGNASTTQKFLSQTGDGVNSAAPQWVTITASGNPAGTTTQVQYNDGGAFGADPYFKYTSSTRKLVLNGTTSSLQVGSSTDFNYFINVFQNASSATFRYTGATSSFTIPSNVTQVTITVAGSPGGGDGSAGSGGISTGTLAVSPGQVYYLCVSGNGGSTATGDGGFCGGGRGGADGGAGFGPGGGGASWVGTAATTSSIDQSTVILVGGGGGGNNTAGGGNGGGLTGGSAGTSGGCTGGGGGTQSAGGSAGTPSGAAGRAGAGGEGATAGNAPGSGGGGGYYGGGGGGGINASCKAGGGGGSGFMKSTLTSTSTSSGAASTSSITFSYIIAQGDSHTSVQSLTATSTFGVAISGHILFGGKTSSTLTSCGTNPSGNGYDTVGQIIAGTGSVTSCTVNFTTQVFQNPPLCFAQDNSSFILLKPVSTTSTLTITAQSSFAGDTINWWCPAI